MEFAGLGRVGRAHPTRSGGQCSYGGEPGGHCHQHRFLDRSDQVQRLLCLRGAERIVRVGDDEILAAMGQYFTDTHNVAEGAGAAPLAALMRERDVMAGKKVGLILSGGNADKVLFSRALLKAEDQG